MRAIWHLSFIAFVTSCAPSVPPVAPVAPINIPNQPTDFFQRDWEFSRETSFISVSDQPAAIKMKTQFSDNCKIGGRIDRSKCDCVSEQFVNNTTKRQAWIFFSGNARNPAMQNEVSPWAVHYLVAASNICKMTADEILASAQPTTPLPTQVNQPSTSTSPTSTYPGNEAENRPIFDASKVPLVNNDARLRMLRYATGVAPKALAISPGGAWAFVTEESNQEEADRLAMERCNFNDHSNSRCFIYAKNNNVVYSP